MKNIYKTLIVVGILAWAFLVLWGFHAEYENWREGEIIKEQGRYIDSSFICITRAYNMSQDKRVPMRLILKERDKYAIWQRKADSIGHKYPKIFKKSNP